MLSAAEIESRRDRVVAEHGGWTADNIHLGQGVYTIGPRADGLAELRVRRTLHLLERIAPKALADLRILDLGALEGGFATALASAGAEVVAVEGRAQHVARIRLAKDVLGLDSLEVVQADVRAFEPDDPAFDVVLCLGLLYHMPSDATLALATNVARWTRSVAIVETQIGLSARESVQIGGETYEGILYQENPADPGAALEGAPSFWPTRHALFRLLERAGFSVLTEVQAPCVYDLDRYDDHVVVLAYPGELSDTGFGWPMRWVAAAHPAQSFAHRIRERVRRARGHGLRDVFAKGQ